MSKLKTNPLADSTIQVLIERTRKRELTMIDNNRILRALYELQAFRRINPTKGKHTLEEQMRLGYSDGSTL